MWTIFHYHKISPSSILFCQLQSHRQILYHIKNLGSITKSCMYVSMLWCLHIFVIWVPLVIYILGEPKYEFSNTEEHISWTCCPGGQSSYYVVHSRIQSKIDHFFSFSTCQKNNLSIFEQLYSTSKIANLYFFRDGHFQFFSLHIWIPGQGFDPFDGVK